MGTLLALHISAATLALLAGYLALGVTKGAFLHRRSGIVFAIAMFLMSLSGAWIAYVRDHSNSVVAGLFTFYFVTTALLTVRRPGAVPAWVHPAAMCFALVVMLMAFRVGLAELPSSKTTAIGMFIFTGFGLLAVIGDVRVLRTGPLRGPSRISRHLWRMCFAMWVAATSFFWGPPNRVPEIIRYPDFYPIPIFTPLVVMFFWLWRVRRKTTTLSLSPSAQAPAQ